MYFVGSVHGNVLGEPHTEVESKLRSPLPVPQHAFLGSSNWYFAGFVIIVTYAFQKSAYRIEHSRHCLRSSPNFLWSISLCSIIAELTGAAHPIWSSLRGWSEEMVIGRQPSGGKPSAIMCFAPAFINVYNRKGEIRDAWCYLIMWLSIYMKLCRS